MFPVPSICIRPKIFAISATVLNLEWRNFDFDFSGNGTGNLAVVD